MDRWFWVCVAGGVGSALRYGISLWAAERLGAWFPYGTLLVNLVGCFSIALVMETALHVADFPATLRLALTTGLLGGLTTYSAFNYDTAKMLEAGDYATAVANVILTLIGCLFAGGLGTLLSRRLVAAL